MKKIIFILFIFLFFVKFNYFYTITSAADFLEIPKNARAISLGDAFSAIINDSSGLEYNPASLNSLQNMSFSIMFNNWLIDSYSIYLSGAYRWKFITFGVSFYYFDYGQLLHYDLFGNTLNLDNPYRPTDLFIKVAGSIDGTNIYSFLKDYSFGVSFSYLQRNFFDNNFASGFIMGSGLNYKSVISIKNLNNVIIYNIPINYCFVIKNIGVTINSNGGWAPFQLVGGVFAEVYKNLFLISDIIFAYGPQFLLKVGLEYILYDIVSFRFGFNFGNDKHFGNIAFGLGLRIPYYFNNLRIDYAFSPLGISGINHNISLYFDFPVFKSKFELYYQQGVYYYILGDYEKAKENWLKALELDKNNELVKKKLEELEILIELQKSIEGEKNK